MPTRPFDFLNGEGTRLSGSLEMPEGIHRGWALFAHCFTCGKRNLAAVRIARALAAAGIGVLRRRTERQGQQGGEDVSCDSSHGVTSFVSKV